MAGFGSFPSIAAQRRVAFKGGGDFATFQDPADLMTYHEDVTLGRNPVVVTYPDGHRAMLGYSVSLATRLGMLRSLGVDPLLQLAAIAEADIRRLI